MNTEIQEVQLNTYPAYKDSGVEWVGKIPKHWEVKKFKHLIKINNGVDYKHIQVDEGYPVIGSGGQFAYASDYLYDGEVVLLGRKGTIDKPLYFNGKFWTVDTMFYAVAHKNNITKFLYYLGSIIPFKFYSTSTALPSMTQDDLNNHSVAIPPLSEQAAIANFLDDKCAKIDAAVEIKQQQIELLKERRQIAIHQAVTQGLDKNVPMKDSGVKWIGEIPEHWVVKKLKQICKAYGRIGFRGYTISDLVDKGEGAITISPSNIKEQDMTFEKSSYLTWEKYYESPEIQVFENDILIVKTGSTFGKVGIVKKLAERATINPQLLVLKNVRLNADYLYELLVNQIVQCQIKSEVIGSTIPTISETKILNIEIALPSSADEILKINDFIKSFRAKINSAISLYEQEIEKLKEYKTTLINSAVTGKMKVPRVN